MAIKLGQQENLQGCVTRLGRANVQPPETVEAMLGYRPGRLSKGYFISVLRQQVIANQVVFEGLTLRSGGRDGLPRADPQADRLRVHNHTRMREEFGDAFVKRQQQKLAIDPTNLIGPDRIVKFIPLDWQVEDNPALEYPMGGGATAYRLRKRLVFFVAVMVDDQGLAHTAEGWSASVAKQAPYDPRARLRRYLDTA